MLMPLSFLTVDPMTLELPLPLLLQGRDRWLRLAAQAIKSLGIPSFGL
jgi:hypothetical protein